MSDHPLRYRTFAFEFLEKTGVGMTQWGESRARKLFAIGYNP